MPAADTAIMEFRRAFESTAIKLGYSVCTSFAASGTSEQRLLEYVKEADAVGTVIHGRMDKYLERLLVKHCRYLIAVGLNNMQASGGLYDQIYCDGFDVAYQAVSHFFQLGHTKIGYMGNTVNEIRFLGYKKAIMEMGLKYSNAFVYETEHTFGGGYETARRLFQSEKRPTAIFCVADRMAVGVLQYAKDHKIELPKELSVIGVDDSESAQYSTPMLSSFYVPWEEMGTLAAKC